MLSVESVVSYHIPSICQRLFAKQNMFSTQFFIRHYFDMICREAGIEPIIEYISNDFNSLMALAQQNRLLFAVPEFCVKHLGSQCRYIPFPEDRFKWNICLVKTDARNCQGPP